MLIFFKGVEFENTNVIFIYAEYCEFHAQKFLPFGISENRVADLCLCAPTI